MSQFILFTMDSAVNIVTPVAAIITLAITDIHGRAILSAALYAWWIRRINSPTPTNNKIDPETIITRGTWLNRSGSVTAIFPNPIINAHSVKFLMWSKAAFRNPSRNSLLDGRTGFGVFSSLMAFIYLWPRGARSVRLHNFPYRMLILAIQVPMYRRATGPTLIHFQNACHIASRARKRFRTGVLKVRMWFHTRQLFIQPFAKIACHSTPCFGES